MIRLLLVLVVLAGCRGGEAPAGATPGAGWPRIVGDDRGRAVRVPARPARVLSLAPSNTELVFALGAAGRLVGRTDACDDPPEAARVPSVGSLFPPDDERIVASRPDLVLMIDGVADLRQRLEARGLPVLVLQPRSVAGTFESIERLGVALGTEEAAAALVGRLRAELAAVRARLPAARPRVFYEVWPDPLTSAGPETFVADLIRQAGGENVVQGAEDWPRYPDELLVASRPEVVVTAHAQTLEAIAAGQRPGWSALPAVRGGRVHLLPDKDLLERPGPRLVEGVRWLAGVLHPR